MMSEITGGLFPSLRDRGRRLIDGHHFASEQNGHVENHGRSEMRVSSSELKIVDLALANRSPARRGVLPAEQEYISYDQLNEGDWDPHAGRRVDVLIAKVDDCVVFLDPDGFVQWDRLNGLLPEGAASIFNRVATLESTPVTGLPKAQQKTYRRLIGEAVAKLLVDESFEDAMVLLDGAESFAVARKRERARVWYFTAAILFLVAAAFSVGVIGFARWMFENWMSETGYAFLVSAAVGALGGFASLSFRLDKLSLDPAGGRALHWIDCCVRLIVAASAAGLITLICQFSIKPIWPIPISLTLIASLAAGAVERLVPSLLMKHHGAAKSSPTSAARAKTVYVGL